MFGRGIVTTPDDFGVYGARPTHPELLDHLAERFVQEGWSVKRMIRAIVLSRTYQLDSKCAPELLKADPDNRFYARHSRRRLDAEEIRDSMLQASGQLNLTPAVGSAVAKIDQLINWPPGEATNLHQASNHRSVYLCMLRNAPPPELAAFNLPRAVDVASQREVTTLPTQSLYLMNGPFVIRQAKALAELALQKVDLNAAQRIRLIFRQALQRNPTEKETQLALDLIDSSMSALASDQLDADNASLRAWASLCHALLATSEFRYVD